MQPMTKMLVLAAALVSTSAAFASTNTTVNIPFSFETHGRTYPAGKYEVRLDLNQNVITLSSRTDTKSSLMWTASPADFGPQMPLLSLKFDNNDDGTHALQRIRLGSRTTPVLDAREHHSAQREVSITGGR
ncbi:hypothetical protein [Pseudacidobacterium ailaaui]|uniref:hypothetical protein n=1 Tax=Pseudacidobacterium ailaaui TaxID=1382359 RepID=UPI00047B229D|nr:hypothetical protein [Pseudacidobacterium ailaaui]